MKNISILLFLAIGLIFSCDKEGETDEPQLIFKYTFSDTQERLGNLGEPVSVAEGNAAQSPTVNSFGVHSIELLNSPYTLPYEGSIVYQGETTTEGGSIAIDFDKESLVGEGDVLASVPISSITPGTYTYLRNSIGYQNGDIEFYYNDATWGEFNVTATVVSFLGFNTYIGTHTVNEQSETVNENKAQGYWAVEINTPIQLLESGQAPATTVPNILGATSPIPNGSCLVTGEIDGGLTISGDETEDIIVTISVSTNNSFEWNEVNVDGKFEPAAGENVVDMGTRGIEASVTY